ncbi:hypothetical protein OESDEN_01437 [Oesophagostomum dentatum]|uniref:Uncharacterized protein n=1 Tax=Oesophagostomum dentatum TaxID=61180 RepID=A0A0B1TRY3_OESDE|nr:hypothetical protein OESDEN_01437 [Oesophagostomum dentatum]
MKMVLPRNAVRQTRARRGQRDGHEQGVVTKKASLSRDGGMAQEEDTRTQQNESIVKDKFAAGVIQDVVTTYNVSIYNKLL